MHPQLKTTLDKMTLSLNDYIEGIDIIQRFFEYQFSELKRDWLYKRIKYLSSETWIALCNQACGANDRVPTVKYLLEIAAPKMRQVKEQRIEIINKFYSEKGYATCNRCNHTGIISAYLKAAPKSQFYAFRCNRCEFADLLDLSPEIKIFDDNLFSIFEIRGRVMTKEDEAWRELYRVGKWKGLKRGLEVGLTKAMDEILENAF